MKTDAVVLRAHGGPEVLVCETVDIGEPGAREILVRVRAVALNHLDLWVRRGLPGLKLAYPHRLGSDVVGEIAAVGPGVRHGVSPGLSCGVCARCLSGADPLCRKYAILGEHVSGGYARHVIVPDENILPWPGELSFTDVAAIPLVFLTAWTMVVEKARVRPGQVVLVHAAGSGVSSAAIQIAKMHGAVVIASARTQAKAERARELGADHVIDGSTQDFVDEVKRITAKAGADVVIDHIGGDVLPRSILATASGGRIVTCGATAGHSSAIDLRHVFFRQIEIVGSTMGSKGSLFEVLRHVRAGRLRPVVDRVLSLWDAREAHRVLEAGEVFGKIVLEVD
jgi:NADPH:quinone reductase-like Zn-dependent oxidoreductase